MIITRSLLVGAAIAAIVGCGGSDPALSGETLGPGGAGGGMALGRGTGGTAGATVVVGGAGAGGSGGSGASGGSLAGRAGTAGGGTAGSAAGGARGGAAGSAAAGVGGAAGTAGAGGTPGTVACDQPILDAASMRDGLIPVTCTLTAGVRYCGAVGGPIDLHCVYVASDRANAVGGVAPYCSNTEMTLDPCGGVIAAGAARIDQTDVTCVYGTSGCDCGPVGKAPDLICTADPTDPRDAFCSAYHPPY